MLGIELDISYAGDNEEVLIITAKGYVDTTTAPEIEKIIDQHLALRRYKIIVNLDEINYISSAGWGVFVGSIRDIRDNNGDLVLTNMSTGVHNIFELMEFTSVLKDFESVDKALIYFLGVRAKKEKIKEQESNSKKQNISSKNSAQPSQSYEIPQSSDKSSAINITNAIDDKMKLARNKLGRRLIRLIIDKPYLGIKDMVRTLRSPQYGELKCKKRDVKRELKMLDLVNDQERYELSLKSRTLSK